MASRSFRYKNTRKENPMKSESYKGVSGEVGAGGQSARNPTGAQRHAFRARPILQAFSDITSQEKSHGISMQMNLLDL